MGPSAWPSSNARSHGHLHEGQPPDIHTSRAGLNPPREPRSKPEPRRGCYSRCQGLGRRTDNRPTTPQASKQRFSLAPKLLVGIDRCLSPWLRSGCHIVRPACAQSLSSRCLALGLRLLLLNQIDKISVLFSRLTDFQEGSSVSVRPSVGPSVQAPKRE